MTPFEQFASGFFHALGACCGFMAFSFAVIGIYLFCAGIVSILQPGPQVNEYHLHGDGEDNGAEERNGFDRFGRE